MVHLLFLLVLPFLLPVHLPTVDHLFHLLLVLRFPRLDRLLPISSIDAGPGMEVPGDLTSQGRDLVNVSGHAIPAVLCGNQYAVLFDAEPTELEDLDGC